MPNEHILLFDEHKLRKFDSSGMPDECFLSFNERIYNLTNEIYNLMNELYVDE